MNQINLHNLDCLEFMCGFALDGCEIDPDYYAAVVERLERHRAQGTFDFEKLT